MELKRCPFCGCDKVVMKEDRAQFRVVCPIRFGGCGTFSRYYSAEEEAQERWNARYEEAR